MGRAMIETDVAIVGAGGGGAVLALMLAQQGVRSLVLERAAGPPHGDGEQAVGVERIGEHLPVA